MTSVNTETNNANTNVNSVNTNVNTSENKETKQITRELVESLGEKVVLLDSDHDLDLFCYLKCTNTDDEVIKRCRGLVFHKNES